jgi:hypothetical protein
MSRVGLCTSLYIVGLQVVDVDTLVVEHAVETVNRKLLIDAIDGSLDILFALVEIILVDRTDGILFQISATGDEQTCCDI